MVDFAQYYRNLEEDFARAEDRSFASRSPEERLLFLYAYYHYFRANGSDIPDMTAGCVYGSDAPDRVAGLYPDDVADHEGLDAILVYTAPDGRDLPSFKKETGLSLFESGGERPSVEQVLNEAELAVHAAQDRRMKARKELRARWEAGVAEEDFRKMDEQRPLHVRIVTAFAPTKMAERQKIRTRLETLTPKYPSTTYEIVFGDEIEHEIQEIEDPRDYVEVAEIQIDKPNNVLWFGEDDSAIVNASACSLKSIYERYGERGLFAQNLRYYVKNAKVDDGIRRSMTDTPEDFWHYNNGVILICDDFSISGSVLKVRRFSIINGGQTTKNIGETSFMGDFHVPCKVIKNRFDVREDRLKFIADVAKASNTQKPIKEKDLIANRVEQRRLKETLQTVGVYCQVKRGEKVNKKLYKQDWQNTTNEEIGQILLSFLYQQPGTARNSKSKILGSTKSRDYYNLIFGRDYNAVFCKDLLILRMHYKRWMQLQRNAAIAGSPADDYIVGLSKNGMLFMMAIIGVICKIRNRPELRTRLFNEVGERVKILSMWDVDHAILKPEIRENKDAIYALFDLCYREFFKEGYGDFKIDQNRGKGNEFSNFTKSDSNYNRFILNKIVKSLCRPDGNGLAEKDRAVCAAVFYTMTEEDRKHDLACINCHNNVGLKGGGAAEADPIDGDAGTRVQKGCRVTSPQHGVGEVIGVNRDEVNFTVKFRTGVCLRYVLPHAFTKGYLVKA